MISGICNLSLHQNTHWGSWDPPHSSLLLLLCRQPMARQGWHLPCTAQWVMALLLLPAGTQLLLSQSHLFLHGRHFLLGTAAVLLEQGSSRSGTGRGLASSRLSAGPQACFLHVKTHTHTNTLH